MTPVNLANRLPLSITTYGILFILLALALFGGFTWLTVNELHALQAETKQRNLRLAQAEVGETVVRVLEETATLAKQFAAWDETLQQLSNSTYYAYWREYRVPSAGFAPDYLTGVELYNRHGIALAKPRDKDLPDKISLPVAACAVNSQSPTSG